MYDIKSFLGTCVENRATDTEMKVHKIQDIFWELIGKIYQFINEFDIDFEEKRNWDLLSLT